MIAAAVDWNAVEAIGTSAGAMVTALAVIVAAVALSAERRNRRADVARLDALREDEQAAQAGLVAGGTTAETGSGKATVTLHNFSQRPVFDVHVSLTLNGRPVELTDGRGTDAPVQAVLAPGEQLEITLNAPFGHEPLVAARMDLRDSMGLRWRRENNSRPRRLLDE